jgi:predicted aminopeptidase
MDQYDFFKQLSHRKLFLKKNTPFNNLKNVHVENEIDECWELALKNTAMDRFMR